MCAQVSDRRREGYADPPSGIDLCITDACDLRCRYCPLWGDKGLKPTPRFMDTAEMPGLVDQLSPFRPSIRLFGGESLLHPDWHLLVAGARRGNTGIP
ncbi:MAG: radical SAM protein [bacterium]|nr:radical SAM protein [bacterium]